MKILQSIPRTVALILTLILSLCSFSAHTVKVAVYAAEDTVNPATLAFARDVTNKISGAGLFNQVDLHVGNPLPTPTLTEPPTRTHVVEPSTITKPGPNSAQDFAGVDLATGRVAPRSRDPLARLLVGWAVAAETARAPAAIKTYPRRMASVLFIVPEFCARTPIELYCLLTSSRKT